jgi:hypothetical protein
MRYQIDQCIGSGEAVWSTFGFPILTRDPAIIHLVVYLENGQRVFFINETASEN